MAKQIQSHLLYFGPVRDEIHQKLAEVLAEGRYPAAECREGDVPGVPKGEYSVWSGTIDTR